MPHHHLVYEFGPYRLDAGRRVLTHAGESIALTPKATDILILLVMNAGEILEKEELLRRIWPDTFVEEANLTQNIFRLRKALGDDPVGSQYIETVTRRGYRFVGQVRTSETPPKSPDGVDPATSGVPIVAVLPFINEASEEELEYIVDGLTDNIINNLSRVSKLRVMSHSSVFRYKAPAVDPQAAGKEMNASVVLVGKVGASQGGAVVSVELIDTANGWQLWGKTFDSGKDLLEIQGVITRQVLDTLKLELTGAEEKRVTARYTENAKAYQAYLEGRYHWSRYTKKGIEKAIRHFRQAIEIDPNYALAYSGIVDCYLRLATNYLPPGPSFEEHRATRGRGHSVDQSNLRIKLRFEWDWKGAERELRRANEFKTHYPAAHQWYAAYRVSKRIYEEACNLKRRPKQSKLATRLAEAREALPPYIPSIELTSSERVQVYCAIVREQIDVGNYDAGCKILCPWWSFGEWPNLEGLDLQSCADLLFTTGELAGFVASSTHLQRGQRHAEELLSGSIALFEQLGLKIRASEARMELALCYYRQGLFDIGRSTLIRVLGELTEDSSELRSLTLLRLGTLERHAGRLDDALDLIFRAIQLAEPCGPWATARCFLELASIYKDLAIAEDNKCYLNEAAHFYGKALEEFEAIGQHRYVAIVENNMGFLLLDIGRYKESEERLLRSRKLLENFSDTLRSAQVDETLARLHIKTKRYALAQAAIERALGTLELADNEVLLAEALTTNGIVASRLGRYNEARKSFEAAYKISERCSDSKGAGHALLIMLEEMPDHLEETERLQIAEKLKKLLGTTQQKALKTRLYKLLAKMEP